MLVIDNKEMNRFEAEIDGYKAIIEYSKPACFLPAAGIGDGAGGGGQWCI